MTGPCVVLAHPRTGSSLLMQTLALLGMPWIGDHHRADLPAGANPRGYLEDRRLLVRGFTQENLARIGPLHGRAMKVSLSHMMAPDRLGQWTWLERSGARLFIPFRHPLESAVSHRVFAPGQDDPRTFFFEVTNFLYHYARDHTALASRLVRDAPGLEARTLLIPYTLHLDDPRAFVEAVRTHAGLAEDGARTAGAIANVQGALYRVRAADMPEQPLSWYDRMPARRVFDTLRFSERPWEDLLDDTDPALG